MKGEGDIARILLVIETLVIVTNVTNGVLPSNMGLPPT